MKQRPLIIQIISLGYLLNPLFFIAQYFYFSQKSIHDVATWQSLLTPYRLSFLILPILVGIGIFKIRMWGWYLFLVHSFFILGNNTLAFLVGSRTPSWAIIGFTVTTLTVIGVLVRQAIREPYFNPRVRWWENKPRYAITFNVEIGNNRKNIRGETFNISEGGFYLVSEDTVVAGEPFTLKLNRGDSTPVYGDGRVVWVNPSGQHLPAGFGFMFTRLDKDAKAEIKKYIKEQTRVLKEMALAR